MIYFCRVLLTLFVLLFFATVGFSAACSLLTEANTSSNLLGLLLLLSPAALIVMAGHWLYKKGTEE